MPRPVTIADLDAALDKAAAIYAGHPLGKALAPVILRLEAEREALALDERITRRAAPPVLEARS